MDSNELYKIPSTNKKADVLCEDVNKQPENGVKSPLDVDITTKQNAHNFSEEKSENNLEELSEVIKKNDCLDKEQGFTLPQTIKSSFERFNQNEDLGYESTPDVQKRMPSAINKEMPSIKEESDTQSEILSIKDNNSVLHPVTKKIVNLPEGYTDSSHSSSSELQPSILPFDSSSPPMENISKPGRINFENALQPNPVWREPDNTSTTEPLLSSSSSSSSSSKPFSDEPPSQSEHPLSPNHNVADIANTEVAVPDPATSALPVISDQSASSGCIDLPMSITVQTNSENSLKPEESNPELSAPAPPPEPVPVVPPAPRKRGRPRKQVLPPTPAGEPFGPNTPQLPTPDKSQELTRSTRSERRTRKKKFEEIENGKPAGTETTPKRRYTPKPKTETKRKKKSKPVYVPKKRGPKPKKHAELENIQNFEEETRMSASEGHGGFQAKSGALLEESQSSFITEGHTKSNINKKGRMEIMTDGCKPITVQQIVEYYWPPPSSLPPGEKPEGLMIQEQITEYLGVKSFKRKYPSIKRRPVEMEERNFLQENGYVSENMCDMGLTAVFSADIIEIMYNDFPQKFDEYRKYTREKKAKEQRALREKQAAERADMDPLKEAVESAQSWNAEFNKTRREKRASCFDLQTFTVHFPANRYRVISLGKPGNYPIALIPGQNTDYYKKYTSNELKYFPLNTVLYGPLKPNERQFTLPSGSDGSQSEIDDDSSSSDESSSSSSEETQDTEDTNSTAEEEPVTETKPEKEAEEKVEPVVVKTPKVIIPRGPRGRGRGRISAAAAAATPNAATTSDQPDPPKKRLGRPPKLKLAAIKLKKLDNEKIAEYVKEERPDTALRVIIHTCKMCHEEESKNKNGEFEAFIECAQCKGKIHPSCIDLTAEMIPKISSYGWQCTDCKSCVKCEQSTNEDKMIFCDQCDRGYHIYCVGLNEVPSGNYICHVCKPPSEEATAVEKAEAEEPEKSEVSENPVEMAMEIKEEGPEVKTEIKTEEESMEVDKISESEMS